MIPYANVNGNSGVTAYQVEGDAITVEFRGGAAYKYTYASTGAANVEQMKALAQAGRGLGTFISQVVKKAYESRVA
jgi:hypothetical protein